MPTGGGNGEFKLVLPSLIPPLPGAFDDVSFDYFINPEGFKVAMQFRMETDNPALLGFFQDSPLLSDCDLAEKWTHIYYGMFESAAKKQGLPPLNIPGELVNRYARTQSLMGMNGLVNDAVLETIEKIKADLEKRKTRDRELSPELAKFWDMIEDEMQTLRDEGRGEGDILNLLLPVSTIQALLQRQQDEYSLLEAYSLR